MLEVAELISLEREQAKARFWVYRLGSGAHFTPELDHCQQFKSNFSLMTLSINLR
jgi:hypothetical protein